MFNYVIFLVLFIGGIVVLGLSHELPAWQGVVFAAGIISISVSLAVIFHAPGTATRHDTSAAEH